MDLTNYVAQMKYVTELRNYVQVKVYSFSAGSSNRSIHFTCCLCQFWPYRNPPPPQQANASELAGSDLTALDTVLNQVTYTMDNGTVYLEVKFSQNKI